MFALLTFSITMFRKILFSLFFAGSVFNIGGQSSVFDGYKHLFVTPQSYVVGYAHQSPIIDGNIEDAVWQKAPWTSAFQDIEGDLKPKPYYQTKAKMLWDSTYLYVAAELCDKHIWSYLKEHDQVVFLDNSFEVFIDPSNTGHRYFEIEINAQNTIFDLFLPKPYRAGSPALISWDSKGLKHKVQIYGSLNDPANEDVKWTVEMAIPLRDISLGNNVRIPKDKEIWRLNFSRVQWETSPVDGKYVKKKDANESLLPENNWLWSAQGIIDMHAPERWGYIQFSTLNAGAKLPEFELPYTELQRQYLWLVYYKQNAYRSSHNGVFAKSLKDLGLSENSEIAGKKNKLHLEATSGQFSASISDSENTLITINNEGYIY